MNSAQSGFLGFIIAALCTGCANMHAGGTDAGESVARVTVDAQVSREDGGAIDTVLVTFSPEQSGDVLQDTAASRRISIIPDAEGKFALNNVALKPGAYILHIASTAGSQAIGCFRRIFLYDTIDYAVSLVDTMRGGISVQGTVGGTTFPPGELSLRLRGFGLSQTLDNIYSFRWNSILPGIQVFTLFHDSLPIGHYFVQAGSSDTVVSLAVSATGELVLDDFTTADVLSPLWIWTGNAAWRWWTNGGGNNRIEPQDLNAAIVADSLNNVLHFTCFTDTGNLNNVSVGLELTSLRSGNARSADFSGMRSLRFRAKGSGNVMVRFLSKPFRDMFGAIRDLEKNITLTPDWTQYEFQGDDSWIPTGPPFDGYDLHWANLAAQMETMAFTVTGDSAEVWIDDIGVDGVDPFDF
jgi:hypothetical protein